MEPDIDDGEVEVELCGSTDDSSEYGYGEDGLNEKGFALFIFEKKFLRWPPKSSLIVKLTIFFQFVNHVNTINIIIHRFRHWKRQGTVIHNKFVQVF